MKKVWESPKIEVQQFTANEYVAACGDQHKVYKFVCDAPKGTMYYYPTRDNATDGVYMGTGSATELGGYTPCDKKHEAPASSAFYDGFVDYNRNRKHDDGEGVIVWVETGNIFGYTYIDNWHGTTKLDMNAWETAKS